MTDLSMQLGWEGWLWLYMAALLIGLSKTGVKGLGLLVAPLLAVVFGGKASAGLVLPMLSMADIMAVTYYNRHAKWNYVFKLLPTAAIGVLLGVWVGQSIDDEAFKMIMGVIIILSLVVMLVQERFKQQVINVQRRWISWVFGLSGGFSTMIGNAAGPVMSLYLLSTRLPKNNFIGTGAWFFLIVNAFKIPFHVIFWGTITWETLQLNLMTLPAILLGAVIGVRLVKVIPEKVFRIFIIVMTFLAAARLFF